MPGRGSRRNVFLRGVYIVCRIASSAGCRRRNRCRCGYGVRRDNYFARHRYRCRSVNTITCEFLRKICVCTQFQIVYFVSTDRSQIKQVKSTPVASTRHRSTSKLRASSSSNVNLMDVTLIRRLTQQKPCKSMRVIFLSLLVLLFLLS